MKVLQVWSKNPMHILWPIWGYCNFGHIS
jgi:hypothetical protein